MAGCIGIIVFLLLRSFLVEGASYEVKVLTGNSFGAGTDADVYIKMYGIDGLKKTSKRELENSGDDFESGSLGTFHISDNVDVGMIEYIQIYRTDVALGKWELEWIRVIHNGKHFLFPYDGWVGPEKWIRINGKCKPPGFRLGSGDSCVGVDACASNPCKENTVCKNVFGSFKCECKDGYQRKDQYSCKDIDECATDPCKENTVCKNTDGSFDCTCKAGYQRKDRYSCKDINECFAQNKCHFKTSSCVNEQGGYSCKCNKGFVKVSRYDCRDKDECTEGGHTCNNTISTCANLYGDFYCKCKTGYHQGQDLKLCLRDECSPLARPYKSIIEPARCTQDRSNYYGDVCTVRCENGYVLENPSYNSVSCGTRGSWSGSTPKCTAVKCPALSAPSKGRLLPSSCATEGSRYQGQCTYFCDKGYKVSGSPVRECRADKTWTGTDPTCVKVVLKPWIRCPLDLSVNLRPGEKTADVSSLWKEPSYLGDTLRVEPKTANANFRFPAGETKVTWTSSNAAGSDTCSILVMVYDKESPKIVTPCPGPVQVLTSTYKATVKWQEPTFSDNVGVTKVIATRKSGEEFGLGSWNVDYTAYDKAGNRKTCEFVVTVRRQGCPVLQGAYGGVKKCSDFGQMKYCTVTCPSGQQVYKNPSPYSVWTCNSANWNPTNIVPDCVAASLSSDSQSCTGNQVKMTVVFSTGSKTYCADCPRGTFSSNGKCKPCAAGQYQDQQGRAACKDCRSGTSSVAGANDANQCRAVCTPGHYSVDGMSPRCLLCPKDTYQDKPKATKCTPCPAGTTTLSDGMARASDCGVKPTITRITPKNQTINEDESTSISCFVTGLPFPAITLKFRRNISAQFLGKETREFLRDPQNKVIGMKLTISGAKLANTGHYECSVENVFGKAVEVSTLIVNREYGSGAGASFDVDELI